jgi:hypothetical protein
MSEFEAIARRKLEEVIERGRTQATTVVERIEREVPDDQIVKARAFQFGITPGGAIRLGFAGRSDSGHVVDPYTVHPNAASQIAATAGIPYRFLRDLLVSDRVEPIQRIRAVGVEGPAEPPTVQVIQDNRWRRDLAERILNEHFFHSEKRHLVRSVRDNVRGVLSDRFRRLDVRPLFESFAQACADIGAVPVDGTSTDVRVSVQAIVPKVYELPSTAHPGEIDPIVLGLDWTNSDFGQAPYAIRLFILRLLCANGMTGQSEIHQRHLGGRLDDRVEWSAQTLEADTKAMRLATGDIVRGSLAPARVESFLASLRAAAERETTFARAITTVGKDLTKAERDAAAAAFDGPDVVNLPKGKTAWRAANAVSWIANSEGVDPQRRLELQELSGRLLPKAA